MPMKTFASALILFWTFSGAAKSSLKNPTAPATTIKITANTTTPVPAKNIQKSKKKKSQPVAQKAPPQHSPLTGLPLFLSLKQCSSTDIVEKSEIAKPLLNQIYLHQFFRICPDDAGKRQHLFKEIQKNYAQLSDFEKFIFKPELSEFENQIALLTPDKKDDLQTLKEKINHVSSSIEREKLLMQALALAQEIKSDRETKELQNQLAENSPRLYPEGKDLFLIAKDYRLNRGFKDAIAIYDQIIAAPQPDSEKTYQAFKEKRQTYKTQQKKNDVLLVDAKITAFDEAQYLTVKAGADKLLLQTWRARLMNDTLIAARALWTESRMNEGKNLALEKMKLLDEETNLDEFYFLFAKMAEEKRDFPEALVQYQKIPQNSLIYPRMLWASGWIYLRQKKFKKAGEQFESLISVTDDATEKIKALFWQAQALKKAKLKNQALEKFREVDAQDPYGYYGLLAHRELKLKYEPLTSTQLPSLQKIFNEVDPSKASTLQTLVDFKMRGYMEIAMKQFKEDVEKKILAAKTGKSKKRKDTPKVAAGRTRDVSAEHSNGRENAPFDVDNDLRFGLIAAYSYAGLYLPLFQYMTSLPPQQKDALLTLYPQLLFPSDYLELISDSATKANLDVALPLSIIRQESAFNPEARSHAEAYGLMQLLPEVAKQYKKRAHVEFQNPQELFTPEVNVPIGCVFLSDLFKKWSQKFIPAVASYNSSARSVKNWLLTRTIQDPLMFIEEIPYEETRGYVKLVMRNHIMYRRIIDQKSFSFPEKFLML